MPSARQPGPDCGHSRGSQGHRAAGASTPAVQDTAKQNAADAQLLAVEVFAPTLQKKLTFDRPLTTTGVSKFLFGDANHNTLVRPVDGSGSRSFILATHDVATIMQLAPAVRDAIIQGGIIRSTGKAWDFPAWLPKNIQDDVVSGSLADGVTHYKGAAGWGDIVVWKGSASVQFYQEFPESLQYYQRISSDPRTARLLQFAYTEWNKDLHHLVEDKGMSPEDARDELRRINDEVFKLVIEGAVAMLSTGAGISQVNNAIRANADQVAGATRRSRRFVENDLQPGIPTRVTVRSDISLSGAGRSGENVKLLTGPPNSAVKSAATGRVFVTNEKGQVILDITAERVKPVQPGVGFGEKRPPTSSEMDLIKQLWKNESD